MDTKHISITDVIERLKEFPEEALDWNTPIDMQRIQDFEREFNIELPHEFVTLLKETNGFSLDFLLRTTNMAWKRSIRMSILKWGTRCLHTSYHSLPMASEITTASM